MEPEDDDQATPQRAAAGFRDAMLAGRWADAFRFATREAQAGLVGAVCLGSAYGAQENDAAGEALEEIFARYDLRDGPERSRDTAELIEIFGALMAWNGRFQAIGLGRDYLALLEDTEYSEFEVRGALAYAISTTRGRRSQARFRLADGRWYLD